MADRDLTRFLPAIVLLSLVGLVIGLQIPVNDTHAEDTIDENNVLVRNAAGPLRFGANSHVETIPLDSHVETIPLDSHVETIPLDSHVETIPLDSHDETIPLDSHDETIPLDSHDETIPLDSHDEMSPAQRMILDRMNDLEKNQESLQKDLRDLINKLKDEP